MTNRILSLAAALSVALSSAAFAQTPVQPTGKWIYDTQGNTIGSVRGYVDGGRTVDIMVGSYFRAGSHPAQVPAGALSVVDGRLTLQSDTVQALNSGSTALR